MRLQLDTFREKMVTKTSSSVCTQHTCGFLKEAVHDRWNCPRFPQKDPSNPEILGAPYNRRSSGVPGKEI